MVTLAGRRHVKSWVVPKFDHRDASLSLYLPLWYQYSDMTGSTIYSYDRNRYTGTVTGTTLSSQGRAMDGDDLIAVGAVADFSFIQNTGIFTVCGWMKMTDHTADRGQGLFGNTTASADKGFAFIYDNRTVASATKQFRVDIMKGTGGTVAITSYSANNMVTDNGFHFWACSGDATKVFFSVDGGVWAQGTSSIAALSSGDSTRVANIGRINAATPLHDLVGTAGEVLVHTRKITDGELSRLYQITKWRFA